MSGSYAIYQLVSTACDRVFISAFCGMKNVVEVCLAVQIVHLGIVFQKNLQPIVSFTVACDYRSNDNNYDFFK